MATINSDEFTQKVKFRKSNVRRGDPQQISIGFFEINILYLT